MSHSAINEGDFDAIAMDIARQLYDSKISTGTIPEALYRATAAQLMNGVFDGMKGKTFAYSNPKNELKTYLNHSIHTFSAAKSLTEMEQFKDLLLKPDGTKKSFIQYRNDCTAAGKVFNINRLHTEYRTVFAAVENAEIFNSFADDDYIQISVLHPCPQCAPLHGFTAKKSDPVWRRLCIPFHFNCRCRFIPGVAHNVKPFKTADLLKNSGIEKYFQKNTAIDKVIVTNDHPYYNAMPQELLPEKNYGMPSVKDIYEKNEFTPLPETTATAEETDHFWYEKTAGKNHFDATDVNGNTLRFDNEFKKHTIKDNEDGRYNLLFSVEDVVKNPDEVWSYIDTKTKKLETLYLKYYENGPVGIRANACRPYTMYEFTDEHGKLNEQSVILRRRGTLLYRRT